MLQPNTGGLSQCWYSAMQKSFQISRTLCGSFQVNQGAVQHAVVLDHVGPDQVRASAGCDLQVWRNSPDAVRLLLEAGANPNLQDGESGW